jgi:hypothetical protein
VKSNSTLRWSSIRSCSQLDIRAAYVGRGKSAQEFSLVVVSWWHRRRRTRMK